MYDYTYWYIEINNLRVYYQLKQGDVMIIGVNVNYEHLDSDPQYLGHLQNLAKLEDNDQFIYFPHFNE